MAVNYVVIPKANPQDREAAPKFYAQAISGSSAQINLSALASGNYVLRLVANGTASAGVQVIKIRQLFTNLSGFENLTSLERRPVRSKKGSKSCKS